VKTLIVGTCYVDTAAKAEVFRLWSRLVLALNPWIDVLVVDSASPVSYRHLAPELEYLVFADNVGHLARGGRDGWGRSFTQGVYAAIDRGYDRLAFVECDILCARPVADGFAAIEGTPGKRCAAPRAMPWPSGMQGAHTDTGLSFWDVTWLSEAKLAERYGWETSVSEVDGGMLPEQRIDALCGEAMLTLPWPGMRNDQGLSVAELETLFPAGMDWITHADLPTLRWFLESNGLDA
jgi:hypothetical protein